MEDFVKQIGDALRDPVAPANLEPEEAFTALCRYAPTIFTYDPTIKGITQGLRSKRLICGAAADLVVGVILYLSGADLLVQRFYGAIKGNTNRPTVTPPIEHPGIKITNNCNGGGGRMFFSGHTIAVVEGIQYDLISGLRGHHIDYTEAYSSDLPDGTIAFTCNIDGNNYVLTKRDDKTPEGLTRYDVAPAMA
jgi:hypothetical protein